MKRILFVDHTAQMGGGEIALFKLLRHIDREKFTPIVLLFADGPLGEKLRPDFEVHILRLGEDVAQTRKDSLGVWSLLKLSAVFKTLWFCLRVSRFISQHRVDLIYTNSLKADLIGGVAGRLARRPVVWHIRDRIDSDYLPQPVVWLFRHLAGLIPSHLIAVSAAALNTISTADDPSTAESSRVARRRSVVHDGIDAREIRVVESSSRRLGLIARISPWKGQHIFIQAAAQVHAQVPEARFYIIGSALFGEQSYEQEIRSLVQKLNLTGVVEFTGYCANVTEHIEQLDVVVHASTSGEPFGQVTIEGMAAAKPVIATNGGGIPEIVVDGETGILVAMGNVPAMASAMLWMLQHPSEAKQMGRKGRERVLRHFSMADSARKVEMAFESVLRIGPNAKGRGFIG